MIRKVIIFRNYLNKKNYSKNSISNKNAMITNIAGVKIRRNTETRNVRVHDKTNEIIAR